MKRFAALATLLLLVSSFGAFTTSQTTVKVLPNPDSSNYKASDIDDAQRSCPKWESIVRP